MCSAMLELQAARSICCSTSCCCRNASRHAAASLALMRPAFTACRIDSASAKPCSAQCVSLVGLIDLHDSAYDQRAPLASADDMDSIQCWDFCLVRFPLLHLKPILGFFLLASA